MKKIIYYFFILGISNLLSTVIDIPNQYATIQEGINNSIDGDTILVQPGTYFENIDFMGKDITVGSLYLLTLDEQFNYTTIINGNRAGSCVAFISEESSEAILAGFTLTNGLGSYAVENIASRGGGILAIESNPTILSCIIEHNFADAGAGIYLNNSIINLSDVTIRNNIATASGGAIFLYDNSNIVFDQTNLCNIYLNYGTNGCEILRGYNEQQGSPLSIIVDTFTVHNPDSYFVSSTDISGQQVEDIDISSLNSYLTPINQDLYVSPNGDNNNSGLTPEDPLKTIHFALSSIQPDSIDCNTIYLADGVYSNNLIDQYFPISMRSYTSLVGQSKEGTILDGLNSTQILYDSRSKFDYSIRNLTFRNGYDANSPGYCALFINDFRSLNSSVVLGDLIFTNNQSTSNVASISNLNLYFHDIIMENNTGGSALRIYQTNEIEHNVYMENCIIRNHTQNISPDVFNAIPVSFGSNILNDNIFSVQMVNCQITDNTKLSWAWPSFSYTGLTVLDHIYIDIVNCTIGNNSDTLASGSTLTLSGENSTINLVNSILCSNTSNQVSLSSSNNLYPSTINIWNSLILGGEESISNSFDWTQVNWLENNLESDPMWLGQSDFPYYLDLDSPCIDAGTLDLPNSIVLPETDLAGNLRSFGDNIDIGAYEWQGVESDDDKILNSITSVWNYPNPFNPSTVIKYQLPENSSIELNIYNIKGQLVKKLVNEVKSSGKHSIKWDGKNDENILSSSGIYYYQLKTDSDHIVGKCILLK